MRANFNFGFDYYPEHWAEEEWPEDLARMRELGVTCVRIAEYAWGRIEPEEGRFEYAWLDRFFALAEEYGISIILGTPGDGLPPWVWQRYPETVLMQDDGRRNTTGRRMRCPTSPQLSQLTERAISALCERYRDNRLLIGWQIDNEITGGLCYCEHCQSACREWLRQKYESVDNLNRALGLVFWAHEVTDWAQVVLPRYDMSKAHPSLRLKVQQFFSEAWGNYIRRQADLIHRLCPGRFVTHNLAGYNNGYDLFEATTSLDFMSMDMYPKAMLDGRWDAGIRNDICRSLQERPHWVLELQSGTPCTKFYKAPIPREGQLRLWAHQSAAHGAAGVVFFRWRKSPAGQEMFGNGLLDHDSRPRRMFHEVKRLGTDFAELARKLPDYDVPRHVAIVMDLADQTNSAIHSFAIDVDFLANLRKWWRAARELGLNVRFVRSTDDLKDYSIVCAVNQYTTSPEIVGNFTDYVRNGGILIGGQRMGFFDMHGKPARLTLPGGMIDLFGVEVEEYERVMEPNPNSLHFIDEVGISVCPCRDWNYVLNDLGARPLATYERDYYAGRTCISENTVEAGHAIYVGTMLEQSDAQALLRYVAKRANLPALPESWPQEVECVSLADGHGRQFCVLLNHGMQSLRVSLGRIAKDVLGNHEGDDWELEPLGLRWLQLC